MAKVFTCAHIARTAFRSKSKRVSCGLRRRFTEHRGSASKSSSQKKTGCVFSSRGLRTTRTKKKTKKRKTESGKWKISKSKNFPFSTFRLPFRNLCQSTKQLPSKNAK